MSDHDKQAPPATRAGQRCPICGKPAQQRFRPFCSARCQTIDLARWIGGSYRVPVEDESPSSQDDEG